MKTPLVKFARVVQDQNMLHVQAEHTLRVSETLNCVACIPPRPGVRLDHCLEDAHKTDLSVGFIGTFRSRYMFSS